MEDGKFVSLRLKGERVLEGNGIWVFACSRRDVGEGRRRALAKLSTLKGMEERLEGTAAGVSSGKLGIRELFQILDDDDYAAIAARRREMLKIASGPEYGIEGYTVAHYLASCKFDAGMELLRRAKADPEYRQILRMRTRPGMSVAGYLFMNSDEAVAEARRLAANGEAFFAHLLAHEARK